MPKRPRISRSSPTLGHPQGFFQDLSIHALPSSILLLAVWNRPSVPIPVRNSSSYVRLYQENELIGDSRRDDSESTFNSVNLSSKRILKIKASVFSSDRKN